MRQRACHSQQAAAAAARVAARMHTAVHGCSSSYGSAALPVRMLERAAASAGCRAGWSAVRVWPKKCNAQDFAQGRHDKQHMQETITPPVKYAADESMYPLMWLNCRWWYVALHSGVFWLILILSRSPARALEDVMTL